ncbi:MAG: cysteine--tRNA ligase [Abditibacteriota bacterium]|nr:cysteine--tRNA ligase [Abditibacteriota bacterium]
MTVTLYNTLTRKKEEFKPLCEGKAGMYTCGPTVYNYAHIGNLRSYIFADILRRTLRYGGYDVKQVMNVTDVGHLTSDGDGGDDKLDAQAKKSGESIWDIARYYEKIFFEDLDKLNIEQPAIKCRATEHIDDMIALVQKLWDKGYAYETAQAVYYDISKFPTYTQLSRQNLEDKLTAVRDEVNEDSEKKHSADFALWFKRVGRFANHIMHWDSPWGDGFPGWHAECSAMSMKYLGETLDIHTGGEDHIWVHHPNEIAQSEGATGKKFVNYWLHGAFLVVDGASKMSKSSGNFLRVQTLIDEGYDPLAYRFMCFSAHYRAKLKFSWESLDAAASAYNNLKDFVARAKQLSDGEEGEWVKAYRDAFAAAIFDDLNMPKAMADVFEMIREAEQRKDYNVLDALFDFDKVLGLSLKDYADSATESDDEIDALIAERNEARAAKNWARADEIRDILNEKGIIIEDSAQGTLWRRK